MCDAYQSQYNIAKERAQTAITKGFHVVLYGKGRTGKSYLFEEIKDFINLNNYKRSFELGESCIDYNNIKPEDKYWIETNRLDIVDKYLKNEKIELINMNNFQYKQLDDPIKSCFY